MKLITKDTDYAIAALVQLAKRNGATVPVSELAGELRISHAFLRKILYILGRNNIVNSCRGIGGGFSLAREPADIAVGDIVEILQGPVRLNDCVMGNDICERKESCVLRIKLEAMETRLVSELMALTIAALITG